MQLRGGHVWSPLVTAHGPANGFRARMETGVDTLDHLFLTGLT